MLEIDFTAQAIPVEEVPGPGLVHLTTGYDPDKGTESVALIAPGGERTEIPMEAGATTTSKSGSTVSKYLTRERLITECGTYEIRGSFRRGPERVILLDVTEDGFHIRPGSAKSYWVVGDTDPFQNDPSMDVLVHYNGGVILVESTKV